MIPRRQERLSSLYQQIVASFLEREIKVAGGILSVTRVELGDNLKVLKIYFSVWPDERERDVLKSVESLKKELRAHLAQRVATKFAPELKFELDSSEKKRIEVEALFKNLKKNK
ncbi:MAG: 30S ribosome-binding factor RbfA [bacterium]|nr:30S ribosome-binding factor RbfA [bacterium]